jgi:enterochelin esterase-like enzyme
MRRFIQFAIALLIPALSFAQKGTTTEITIPSKVARTILAGSSAGGLGAAYIAFKYPSLFRNVLSQSGACWRRNEASNAAPTNG